MWFRVSRRLPLRIAEMVDIGILTSADSFNCVTP